MVRCSVVLLFGCSVVRVFVTFGQLFRYAHKRIVNIMKGYIERNNMFFLLFPLCRGEAGLLVTAKYGYFRD